MSVWWVSRFERLASGDNGVAGASGQPVRPLFPSLLRGLREGTNHSREAVSGHGPVVDLIIK